MALTQEALKAEREQWEKTVEILFIGEAFQTHPELRGITLLLVTGVQYLIVQARTTRIFGGIDVQSEGGLSKIKASLTAASRSGPGTNPSLRLPASPKIPGTRLAFFDSK
jgi:hypothetical protein